VQVGLRDLLGIAPGMIGLTPAAYFIATHFNGARSLRETHRMVSASHPRAGIGLEQVCELADALEQAGFIEGAVFEGMRERVLADFRANPLREPVCAGGAYPDDPSALRQFLDAFFLHADGPGPRGLAMSGPPVTALVAPHIDLHRGGPSYAHAYRALYEGCDAELFIVFGTAHATPPHLFTLTRKSYDTPLGAVPTDRGVVDALARALGEDELFADELVHKSEHSIEFQMLWLRHLYPGKEIRAVPILCSSIDHLATPGLEVRRFIDALQQAIAGRKVCFIAGADLAHIGVLYGDPRGPTPAELQQARNDDLASLAHFCGPDAHAFAVDARRDGERRRLCGTAPMFAARLAAGPATTGDLLSYGQWTDGTDSVSFCAVRLA
jgi:AmmeMemoRadiSam system protein B